VGIKERARSHIYVHKELDRRDTRLAAGIISAVYGATIKAFVIIKDWYGSNNRKLDFSDWSRNDDDEGSVKKIKRKTRG